MSANIEPSATGVPGNYNVKTLPAIPKLGTLYSRGAVGSLATTAAASKGVAKLPNIAYEVTDVKTVPLLHHLVEYQRLVKEPISDVLPSGYLHTLAFPLAMAVMIRTDFPLPLLGMVHLANDATLYSPVHLGDVLEVLAWTENLRPHKRGVQVDIVAEILKLPPVAEDGTAVGEPTLAWRGVSTYLAKGVKMRAGAAGSDGVPDSGDASDAVAAGAAGAGAARADTADATPDASEAEPAEVGYLEPAEIEPVAATTGHADWTPPHPTARWRLTGGLGREFGAVSGDRNPIHMSKLSAKAFGFPRTIAHGMYTAARALAETGAGRGDTYRWTVEFAKPVLLPSTVEVAINKSKTPEGGVAYDYVGWNGSKNIRHFSGTVTPL